jgi:hypothetical protein
MEIKKIIFQALEKEEKNSSARRKKLISKLEKQSTEAIKSNNPPINRKIFKKPYDFVFFVFCLLFEKNSGKS